MHSARRLKSRNRAVTSLIGAGDLPYRLARLLALDRLSLFSYHHKYVARIELGEDAPELRAIVLVALRFLRKMAAAPSP
jgi:hypothetical protein